MTADDLKRRAAEEAVKLVEPEMTLGLGTGSTAAHFVDLLGERVRTGLRVRAIPTSEATRRQAVEAGIDIIEPDETTQIDLAVDGTDEIAKGAGGLLNLIKGGGGAHLREKIIAAAAWRFVVIADASKKVAELGAFPLPVEIDRFSFGLTVRRLRDTLAAMKLPSDLTLRVGREGTPFLSDGGHFIIDCRLKRIPDPAALEHALQSIPGVIETGLFIGVAERAFLAGPEGVETLTRR